MSWWWLNFFNLSLGMRWSNIPDQFLHQYWPWKVDRVQSIVRRFTLKFLCRCHNNILCFRYHLHTFSHSGWCSNDWPHVTQHENDPNTSTMKWDFKYGYMLHTLLTISESLSYKLLYLATWWWDWSRLIAAAVQVVYKIGGSWYLLYISVVAPLCRPFIIQTTDVAQWQTQCNPVSVWKHLKDFFFFFFFLILLLLLLMLNLNDIAFRLLLFLQFLLMILQ